MRLTLTILTNGNRPVEKAYTGITERIKGYNKIIEVTEYKDLQYLANYISSNGSVFNKIVIMSLIKDDGTVPNTFYEDIVDAITIISQNLSSNQSIVVIEKEGESSKLSTYIGEHCLHLNNVQFKPIEKSTPGDVVAALFGVKKLNVKQATAEINNAIAEQNAPVVVEEAEEAVVAVADDDDGEAVAVTEEDSPRKKNKIFNGLFGKRNKSNSDESVTYDEESVVMTEDDEESVVMAEDDSEPVVTMEEEPPMPKTKTIKRLQKPEEDTTSDTSDNTVKSSLKDRLFGKKPKAEAVEPVVVVSDEKDVDSSPVVDTPIPTASANTNIPNNPPPSNPFNPMGGSGMPTFIPPKSNLDDLDDLYDGDGDAPEEPVVVPTTVPETKSKIGIKGIFGNQRDADKAARKQEKKYNKEQLSMVRRPKIVAVTGGGRIGVSTLAASLGFVGAERMCNTLIVDLDFIKRTQSCIFKNLENDYSASVQSGIAGAVESPHLTQQYAYETHTRLSHLGVDITCELNRKYLQEIETDRLKNMFTALLTMYNLIVVDVPWNYLVEHSELAYVFNSIIYVSSNDMITIVNDANLLDPTAFKRVSDFSHIMNKMSFVLNMISPENVNGNKKITGRNFSDIMYDITQQDDFIDMPVLAEIPLVSNVGNQASYSQPASAYSDIIHSYCLEILYRLSDR